MKRLIFTALLLFSASLSLFGADRDLLDASRKGDIGAIRQALAEGAEVNTAGRDGNTALHLASRKGYINTVNLLISSGARLNARRRDGRTPLILAVSGRHAAVAKLLIEKGANMNTADEYGVTALMFASYHGMADVVNLLLEKGANVNQRNHTGMTALMYTARYSTAAGSRVDVAKQLIRKGANVNAKDCDAGSALLYAGETGSREISDILLKSGASEEGREQVAANKRPEGEAIAVIDNSHSPEPSPAGKKNDASTARPSGQTDTGRESAAPQKKENIAPPVDPGPPDPKKYRLVDVSTSYSSFYMTDLDPLKKNRVERIKTGMGKYDTFFDQSKKILINVNFAQGVLANYKLKKDKNEDTSMEKGAVVALLTSLPGMVKEVKGLIDSGNQLASSVKSDFTGMNALKLPSVLKGLASTVSDLVEVGKAISQTVEALKGIQ